MSKPAEPLVGIIMGIKSDFPTMQFASVLLKLFNVPHERRVVSAHRTPDRMVNHARQAEQGGLRIIIAGAVGAAHPPESGRPEKEERWGILRPLANRRNLHLHRILQRGKSSLLDHTTEKK